MPITMHRVSENEIEERRRVPLTDYNDELRAIANERADLLAMVVDLEEKLAEIKTRAIATNTKMNNKLAVLRDNAYPDPDWLPAYEERYPNPDFLR